MDTIHRASADAAAQLEEAVRPIVGDRYDDALAAAQSEMQISKALQWLVRALQALKRIKTAIEQALRTQSLLVRTGARALGVNRALRFLDPASMLVRGVTG